MEIFRNDKLIGINNFYFSKENDLMKVKNIVQFKISIAGIDLMKVDSESAGIYKDDMLIKFNSKTKQNDKDKFLDFLAIESNIMPDNNNEMKIIFAGDSIIKIISEVIEVTLDDQGEAWDTKNKPKHKTL